MMLHLTLSSLVGSTFETLPDSVIPLGIDQWSVIFRLTDSTLEVGRGMGWGGVKS